MWVSHGLRSVETAAKMSVCQAFFITAQPSDGQPSVSHYKRGAVSARLTAMPLSPRDPHVSVLNESYSLFYHIPRRVCYDSKGRIGYFGTLEFTGSVMGLLITCIL